MKVNNKVLLAAGVAVAALLSSQAFAQVTTSASLNKTYDEDVNVNYDNDVDVDIAKDIDVSKDLDFNGVVVITGNINVSEAAMSVIDNKQIVDDNIIDVLGSDATLSNVAMVDGLALSGAGGNVGLNVSVGDNLLQENVAALSAIGGTAGAGSSDAEVFSVQKSINNEFDDGVEDAEVFNNTQLIDSVLSGATGNIGVNVATGAFNAQKNATAIAAVTGSATLSEAVAAVLQESTFNDTSHTDTTNEVKVIDIAQNVAGNIGINATAGTNNLQQNTLVISSVSP